MANNQVLDNGPITMDRRAALQHSLLGGVALAGVGLSVLPGEASAQSTGDTVRLVVTGNNAQEKSYIVSDESVKRGVVWSNDPKQPLGPGRPGDTKKLFPTESNINPEVGGARMQFYSIAPSQKKKGEKLERVLGKDGFHRTATIDYVVVMSGEVTLILEEGEVMLHPGDIIVQRNTLHAWLNYGTSPAALLAMLIHV